MNIELNVDGRKFEVEVVSRGGHTRILLGGEEVACDCVALGEGRYSLILGGRVHDLSVDLSNERCTVTGPNGRVSLTIKDSRRLLQTDLSEGENGLRPIHADMPGRVIRIMVRPGDIVDLDQGLLVLEAMKMQNEIRAPRSGIVREIGVKEGEAVGSGGFLLNLE